MAASAPSGENVPLKPGDQYLRHSIDWRIDELQSCGVTGIDDVQPADLKSEVHPIFAREKFILTDERFKKLEQSSRLASKFLELSLPYFASWLPVPNFVRQQRASKKADDLESFPGQVEIRATPSQSEIEAARTMINSISDHVRWAESAAALRNGLWGITTSILPRPNVGVDGLRKYIKYGNMEQRGKESIDAYDEELKASNQPFRELTVHICSQYIDILERTNEDTESHLTATFHAAVTMFQELAHVFYVANFSTNINPRGMDPLVNQEVTPELGHSLISWLFGGWCPEPNEMRDEGVRAQDFAIGSSWWPRWSRPLSDPKWTVVYSMPFSYVQRILTQGSWDEVRGLGHMHPKTRNLLDPSLFSAKHARRLLPLSKGDRECLFFGEKWRKVKGPVVSDGYESPPLHPQTTDLSPRVSGHGGNPHDDDIDSDWELDEPTIQNRVYYNVHYMGVFDERSQTYEPPLPPTRKRRADNETQRRFAIEKIFKGIPPNYDTMSWGCLLANCHRRGISDLGNRDELVIRLKLYEAERKQSNTGNQEVTLRETPPASFPLRVGEEIFRDFLIIDQGVKAYLIFVLTSLNICVRPELLIIRVGGPNGFELNPHTPNEELVEMNLTGWDDVCVYRRRLAKPCPAEPQPEWNVHRMRKIYSESLKKKEGIQAALPGSMIQPLPITNAIGKPASSTFGVSSSLVNELGGTVEQQRKRIDGIRQKAEETSVQQAELSQSRRFSHN